MHKSSKFDLFMDQQNFFVKKLKKIGPQVNTCKPPNCAIRDRTCNRSNVVVPMSIDHYERRSMLMGRSFTLLHVRILL
jgi:hypothetical protein